MERGVRPPMPVIRIVFFYCYPLDPLLLIDPSVIFCRCVIAISTHLMRIQPTSQKTPMYDLYNPILLLWSHLVVAGQAQASAEDICTNINPASGDISI